MVERHVGLFLDSTTNVIFIEIVMALTAAERSKRYREKIKQNPEKNAIHKKKELERLKKHSKKITELTEEEKEIKRKHWREQKRKQKKKNAQNKTSRQQQQSTAVAATTSKITKTKNIQNKCRRLKYNYNVALKKIETYKTALSNIRKKLYREKKRNEKVTQTLTAENEKLKARQEVMELAMRGEYMNCKKATEKRIIKKIALKIGHTAENKLLGLRGRVRKAKLKMKPMNKSVADEFEEFFCRDDVSRSTAGKRETRTKNKKKVQIRYLLDTLKNMYQFYKDEGGKYSFTTFFRYKPFYVLSPSAMKRDTCLCVKHSNMQFMFESLKHKDVIPYKSTTELLQNIVCDVKSLKCMYNECQLCKTKSITYNTDKLEDEVTWYKWDRVVHRYEKSGKEINTKKITKQQKKGTIRKLIQEFENQLLTFKKHYFNWKEQHRQYRACVTNMKENEIGILCDFSENYDCKYGAEIQSTHFGASKTSITLHSGVIIGKEGLQSFVTISDHNCHEPHAIWAHLLPIIKIAKEQFPNFKIIHFFSDGPTTQYRQKKNFFLLNLFTQKLKLEYSSWSFSEAGHGKSMADGIGGSVKRQLDKRVAYGHDITNATEAYHVLQSTMKSVKCIYVSEMDVRNVEKLIPDDLIAVPGTMQLHQIISTENNKIQYRQLSCFCGEKRALCNCNHLKTHRLTDRPEATSKSLFRSDDMTREEELIQSLAVATKPDTPTELSPTPDTFTDPKPSTSRDTPVSEYSTNWLLTASLPSYESDIIDCLDVSFLNTDSLLRIESLEHNNLALNNQKTDESFSDAIKIEDEIPTEFPCAKKEIAEILCEKRVRIHKPYDDLIHVMSPNKKYKISFPKTSNHKSKQKSLKVLIPKDKQTKENIMYPSSARTFPCHICKARQRFILREMANCMVCHKWVCASCSGTTAFDYICPVCLSG